MPALRDVPKVPTTAKTRMDTTATILERSKRKEPP